MAVDALERRHRELQQLLREPTVDPDTELDRKLRQQEQRLRLHRRTHAPTTARLLQLTAEHEAAHAIVATVLGMPVVSVTVVADDDHDGTTRFRHAGAPRRSVAAVGIAGWLWTTQIRWQQFPEAAGDPAGAVDLRILATHAGDRVAANEAGKLAYAVLMERYDDVLDLAAELVAQKTITSAGFVNWARRRGVPFAVPDGDSARNTRGHRLAPSRPTSSRYDPYARMLADMREFGYDPGWMG